jgi:hypothetical protein
MLVLMQATQPPRSVKVSHVQNDQRVTVWTALWRHLLMGSYFFDSSPTCETHHQTLKAFWTAFDSYNYEACGSIRMVQSHILNHSSGMFKYFPKRTRR